MCTDFGEMGSFSGMLAKAVILKNEPKYQTTKPT
jgi:hypothetical protein